MLSSGTTDGGCDRQLKELVISDPDDIAAFLEWKRNRERGLAATLAATTATAATGLIGEVKESGDNPLGTPKKLGDVCLKRKLEVYDEDGGHRKRKRNSEMNRRDEDKQNTSKLQEEGDEDEKKKEEEEEDEEGTKKRKKVKKERRKSDKEKLFTPKKSANSSSKKKKKEKGKEKGKEKEKEKEKKEKKKEKKEKEKEKKEEEKIMIVIEEDKEKEKIMIVIEEDKEEETKKKEGGKDYLERKRKKKEKREVECEKEKKRENEKIIIVIEEDKDKDKDKEEDKEEEEEEKEGDKEEEEEEEEEVEKKKEGEEDNLERKKKKKEKREEESDKEKKRENKEKIIKREKVKEKKENKSEKVKEKEKEKKEKEKEVIQSDVKESAADANLIIKRRSAPIAIPTSDASDAETVPSPKRKIDYWKNFTKKVKERKPVESSAHHFLNFDPLLFERLLKSQTCDENIVNLIKQSRRNTRSLAEIRKERAKKRRETYKHTLTELKLMQGYTTSTNIPISSHSNTNQSLPPTDITVTSTPRTTSSADRIEALLLYHPRKLIDHTAHSKPYSALLFCPKGISGRRPFALYPHVDYTEETHLNDSDEDNEAADVSDEDDEVIEVAEEGEDQYDFEDGLIVPDDYFSEGEIEADLKTYVMVGKGKEKKNKTKAFSLPSYFGVNYNINELTGENRMKAEALTMIPLMALPIDLTKVDEIDVREKKNREEDETKEEGEEEENEGGTADIRKPKKKEEYLPDHLLPELFKVVEKNSTLTKPYLVRKFKEIYPSYSLLKIANSLKANCTYNPKHKCWTLKTDVPSKASCNDVIFEGDTVPNSSST